MPRATGVTRITTTSEKGHPTTTVDQGVAQGERIILARRLLLPRIRLPHERRRGPVEAPRRDYVHTSAPWGTMSGAAALGQEPTWLGPALPHRLQRFRSCAEIRVA